MDRRPSLLIGGNWISNEDRPQLPVINPATGSGIWSHPIASRTDVNAAAEAADIAFRDWQRQTPRHRAKLIAVAAGILRSNANEIARALTLEQGKPLAEARNEVESAAAYTEWYAQEAIRTFGTNVCSPDDTTVEYVTTFEPVGPTLILVPWNFPIAEAAVHVAPALASGCSIILKSPEEAPSAAMAYAQAFVAAGAPPGLVNVLMGDPGMIAEQLIADPRIRRVAFTGSTAVGKQLASLAGANAKRSTMELGGDAPVIIDLDADISRAVPEISAAKFRNAGQVCVAPNRIFVHEKILDVVTEGFAKVASNLVVGDGLAPDTTMGPMANARRIDAMERLLSDAKVRGAKIVCGGNRIGQVGCFWEPTVVTGAPDDSEIANTEIFGPIISLYSFSSMDEAIRRANSTKAGLAAYGYTTSQSTANRLGKSLRAGMVGINTMKIFATPTPFGGMRDSGWGKIGGREGLFECMEMKLVARG
jgi:succinate-semialdehyde dehydrogenase/glutarate-semialdehyde dehydrogenase